MSFHNDGDGLSDAMKRRKRKILNLYLPRTAQDLEFVVGGGVNLI